MMLIHLQGEKKEEKEFLHLSPSQDFGTKQRGEGNGEKKMVNWEKWRTTDYFQRESIYWSHARI